MNDVELQKEIDTIAALIAFADDPNLSALERIIALELAVKSVVESMTLLSKQQGPKGDSPTREQLLELIKPIIPKVHTPTKEELTALITPLIPKSKDGKTPTTEELIKLITPLIPITRNGTTPIQGIDYFVPTIEEVAREVASKYLMPSEIFRVIFSLPDNLVSALNSAQGQIKTERIEGLEKLINEVHKKHWPPFYVGQGGTSGSTTGVNISDELVTAVQSGSNVTIDLSQLGHSYSTVLQVRRNGIPQVRTAAWTQSGSSVTVLGADAGEYFEIQYTYA